jgi:Xaa-Pro aminopeptidase
MFEAKFQTFEDASERDRSAARVGALRAELKRRSLTGLVVPRADRQQNEYLPASEERLAWLTGFTGSAGAAVVLADKAAVFVDGRYTVQADAQIDKAVFAIEHLVDTPPSQWLAKNTKVGDRIGYDPWLHTSESVERLKQA